MGMDRSRIELHPGNTSDEDAARLMDLVALYGLCEICRSARYPVHHLERRPEGAVLDARIACRCAPISEAEWHSNPGAASVLGGGRTRPKSELRELGMDKFG